MVRTASSFILAAVPLQVGASTSDDEVVLLQAHHTVNSMPHMPSDYRAETPEMRAEALVQTYEDMVRDVIHRGPDALPTDAVLDPAINQFETLKVELKADRSTQQETVNDANADLGACNERLTTSRDTADTGVNALKSSADAARNTHKECRVSENTLAADRDGKCGAFSTSASGHQCGSEDWLSANGDGLVAAAKACVASKGGIVDTEQQCDHDQQAFEGKFCAYASALSSACEAYTECWADNVERRTSAYDNAKELEESHKRIWVAYEKAVCFLTLLKDARGDDLTEDKLQACIARVPNTSELDMTYPGAPSAQTCDTSSIDNVPGEDAWRADEYGSSPFSDNPEHLSATDVCPQGSFKVPEGHLSACAHEDGWEYVTDYGDDRSKDDLPDDATAIRAGFSNGNAYYIGDAELEKLDLEEVQVCGFVSGENCKKSCYTLSTNLENWYVHGSPNNIPSACASVLSTPLKKMISILSGACADQPHFWMYQLPSMTYSTFEGTNCGWQCRGYRGWYTHAGNSGGWHAQGWGISLQTKGRIGLHMNNPNQEIGWYGSTCGSCVNEVDIDTFQIKVKVAQ